MRNTKELLEQLRNTTSMKMRMTLLAQLTNDEQFELDKYLVFGERTVDGVVCFPYRNGKYFNEKPTAKVHWIPNRYVPLSNTAIEPVQNRDNYRSLNILRLGSNRRRAENVHFINEMYIDIDLGHKDDASATEHNRLLRLLLDYLLDAFHTSELLRPTSFLFSGRGFALHYVLKEPISVDSEDAISFAAVYQCAFDKFERLLETHVSEAKADVDRVVYGLGRLGRMAGTWNSKGKCHSRFVDVTGQFFSIDELIDGFVEDSEDYELRKTLKRAGKGITKAAMTRYYAKLERKLLKKQQLSDKQIQKTEQANKTIRQYETSVDAMSEQQLSQWCHIAFHGLIHLNQFFALREWIDGSGRYQFGLIYYNLSRTLYEPDHAEYSLRNIVDMMKEPLDEDAIERIIEGSEDTITAEGYSLRFTYDTICEKLNIPLEIAEKCGLVSTATRAKRVEENINAATERDKEIMRMHDKGISKRKIAEILKDAHPNWKISKSTVSRTISKFKECNIEDLNRTTYVNYMYKNARSNIQSGELSQLSNNVVIKDSSTGALVKEQNTNPELLIAELSSENPITEKSDNQFKEYILRLLQNGNNIFLHGMGGCGKTYLIKRYIELCKQANRNVAIVAPTAVATTNYESAATIHSFFHLSTGIVDENMVSLLQIQPLENIDVLVIDEMSMVRCDLFDIILYTIEKAEHRYHKQIQLILCGDVGQLPCVITDEDKIELSKRYNSIQYMFFNAHRFPSLVLQNVQLEKNRRTNPNELLYAQIMKHIHDGDFRVLPLLDDRIISKQLTPPEDIIVLAAHRATVKRINDNAIAKHKSDSSFKYIHVTGSSDASEDDYPVPLQLPVFEGMKIMFVINRPKRGYVNGTMAEILTIQKDSITVLTDGKRFEVKREQFVSKIDKTKAIKQYPFVPAYAITIHKSQGLSLDQALIFPDCFASGMLYTALSRLRSMDGLYLASPIPAAALLTNAEASEYFQQLNLITVENYNTAKGMP